MIFDRTENLSLYEGVNPHIHEVVSFLETHDLLAFPAGRVDIADGVYANFDIAQGKQREAALLESHNLMVDIQIVLDAEEEIWWSPRSDLPQAAYNKMRDISFYESEMPQQYLVLKPGFFVLFLPADAHAPCICKAECYRKVVFKLEVVSTVP